jgi:hypothetical protein
VVRRVEGQELLEELPQVVGDHDLLLHKLQSYKQLVKVKLFISVLLICLPLDVAAANNFLLLLSLPSSLVLQYMRPRCREKGCAACRRWG